MTEQKILATSISSAVAEGTGEGDSHTLQVFQTHRAEGKKDKTTVYQNAGNYMPEGGMRGGGGKAGERGGAEKSFEVLLSRNLV